jgi:hypothetical protein
MMIKTPFLFPRPRALVEIAPERPLLSVPPARVLREPEGVTIRAAAVAALLDECHRPALSFFEGADGFNFGEHWRWERGERAYTPAGLRWLGDAFHNCVSPVAALALRRAQRELESAGVEGARR